MNIKLKKSIIRVILLLLLCGFILVYLSQKEPLKPLHPVEGDYGYSIEYAEFRIRKLMDMHHLPGLAVTLVSDQHTIWQQSFGMSNIEEELPAGDDTVYKLYSLAKVFTAIEIMRLVEEGRVGLDQPITEVLPDFTVSQRYPESAAITVRSLLTHRSGLPRNGCHQVAYGPDALSELVASLAECPVAYPPGERYKYSNIGFNVLGRLIEKMRIEPFQDYMRENLFRQIGMAHSSFGETQIPSHLDLAAGYEYFEREYYPLPQGNIATLASGNLYAPIDDMALFLKFLFNGGQTDRGQLIEAETLAEMMADQPGNLLDGQTTGLGWKTATVFNGEHLVWHDGGPTEGIGGLIAFLPEHKLGLVLIANATAFESHLSLDLAIDVLEHMLAARTGTYPQTGMVQSKVDSKELSLESITGRYAAFGDILEITTTGDRLRASYQGFGLNLSRVGINTSQPGHWLLDLGLGPFLGMPYDLSRLRLVFVSGPAPGETTLLLQFDGAAGETSPIYPPLEEYTDVMEAIVGEYALLLRYPPGIVADDIVGYSEISLEDGILRMSGSVGPIAPIRPTELLILSGPFAGEIMVYEPEHNAILHQMVVYYKP